MSSSDRMLKILTLFSLDRSELTVEQAAKSLGSTSSTTYRYFASLSKAGLIAPSGMGRYIVGPAAINLDWLIRNTDPLIAAAKPAMTILARAINRPAVVLLCRLYRGQVMCIARENIRNPPYAISYQRGRPMPLYRGAASKIILANMSDRALRSLIQEREQEMRDAKLGENSAQIRKYLRELRASGISVTHGELDSGLVGVAAPILFRDSLPAGSLAFVLADKDADEESIERYSHLLRAAAFQVTESVSSTAS